MKKLLQRWLAMVLAALMVMGTLPTSAWAARVTDDEARENPVLDQNDPVADTQGKYDDKEQGEKPVDPIDPDGPPADLTDILVEKTGVSINAGAVSSQGPTEIFASAVATGADASVIMIVPRFVTSATSGSTAISIENYPDATRKDAFTQNFVSDGSASGQLSSFNGFPFFYTKTADMSNVTGIKVLWDGSIVITTTTGTGGEAVSTDHTMTSSQLDSTGNFSQLKAAGLSEWAEGRKLYYPRNHEDSTKAGKEIPYTTEGLPFTVIMGGSGGFGFATVNLPVTGSPLKVEIQTKDAVTRTAFKYAATSANNSYAAGEQLFTEVILTNTTGSDMTVKVTIEREFISISRPDNYGNNENITDASESKVATTLKAQNTGLTTTASPPSNKTTDLALKYVYGLLANWNGDIPEGNTIVPGGQNGNTATELTVEIKAGKTTTIYMAGTASGQSANNYGYGLGGVKVDSKAHTDFWSNYKIKAEVTATDIAANVGATASDVGGIRWVDNPTTEPKVRLMHGTENIKPFAADGTTAINQGESVGKDSFNGTTGTKKGHTVVVDSQPLIWNNTAEYYELPEGKTVRIGRPIYVDGVRTDKVSLADTAAIIEVPMGTVSVEDDPDGSFTVTGEDGTEKDIYGHYMWDDTATADADSMKKVTYQYYPIGATVGVYANKTKFLNWTDVTSTEPLKSPGGSVLEENSAGTPTNVAAARVKVTGDMTVTANYMKPITVVTTHGGKNVGDNSLLPGSDSGDRDTDYSYTFKIEMVAKDEGGVGASWTKAADGGAHEEVGAVTAQTKGNAWAFDLNAGNYELKVNGRSVKTFNTEGLTTYGDTEYNFVVELVGVIPQVDGSTQAGSTLTLPDDQNPNRERGDVKVTGAAPNKGENPITLYYPENVNVQVKGEIATGDNFSELTYDGTPQGTATNDAATAWYVDATGNNMKFNLSGDKTLIASFTPAAIPVTVTVNLDGTASHTPIGSKKVELRKTDAADGSKDIELVKQTGTGEDGLYKKDVEPGTYKILVNDKDTGVTVTVAAPSVSATLNYYNVEVKTDGHGAAKVEATSKTDLVGSAATFVETSSTTGAKLIVFDGTAVKWTYGDPATNYEPKGWDDTASSAAITLASVSNTSTNTHTANFQKKLAPLTIHVRKSNATTDFTGYTKNIVLTTSSTSATTNPVTLTKGNAYTFSHAGLEAGQTYYIWAVTNATGSTYKMVESFTVPDSKDAISKDVIYYTLTVAADTSVDAGATARVAHGTTAPTDGTNTSVVVLSGEKATVKAFPSNTTKFSWLKWESSDKDTLAAPTDQSATVTTVEADITLTAYFQRDKYDTYLQIKLNGSVLAPADVGSGKDVTGAPTLGSYTVSYDTDKKAWKATVPVSDTTTKWSVGAVTSQSFSKAMVNGTDGSVQTLELFSLSLSVATASTGLGAVSPANKMVYEKNTNVSIAATPTNSDYKWTSWTVTKGDDPAAATKTFAITKETELAANFAKKTGTVTVKVMLDGTTPVNDATVVLNGTTFSGTAPTDGVYTFTNVEYNEHGTAYTLTVSKTGYIGTSTQSVTVKQATTAATQVNFYTVDVSTNGNGTATMKVGSEDTVTASTTTAVEKVALAGTKVVWTVGTPAANHSFSYWDNEETGSKETTITVNSLGAKTGHKAFFLKDRFNATLDLKLNDSAVGAFNTDIISITVRKKDGDKPFTTKSLTAEDDYDATNKVWKVEGLPSGNTYTWTVTTLGNKTFTADTGSGAVDPDQQSISLYSLITSVASGQSTWGTATPNTRGIFKSGTSVTVTATPSTNYKFVEWTATKGDKPTTASATFNIDKETELVASFARKTSDVTVTILLDGEADSYTGDTVPYHVTLATSSITGTQGTGGNKHVYTFKDVPHNEGETAYTLTVTRDGYYGTYTQANITVKDGSTNDFTVNYYTAKAKTAGANAAAARGDAKLSAGSGESTVTATTAYKNTTTPTIEASIVVLSGTSVTWEAYNPADNYSFAYWDGTSGEKNATHAWTVNAKGVEHTAFFTKNAYNTYLDLTVNGEKWGTKGASDKNIKNVQLVTAINGTTPVADVTVGYNETGKLWEAKGIASNTTNAQPYWRVTTVDDGVYYTKASIADKTTDATVAAATVTETLFGIAIEDGAGNGTGNKPTLKAQTASTAAARIVTRANTTATVALNKKTGYTFSDWAMKKGLAPAVGDTDATNMGDGNATAYTLDTNYAAPATAPTDGDLDLHIMPVYTYEVTVKTVKGSDNSSLTVGNITLKHDTEDDREQANTSSKTFTGLTVGETYEVWVNGYKAGDTTVSEADITNGVTVKMWNITAVADPTAAAKTNFPKVNTAVGSAGIYVPNGAELTGDTVEVKATNGDAADGYRWLDPTSEKLWDVTTGGDVATIANATGVITTNENKKVTKDIQVTVYGMKRWTVTAVDDPTDKGTTIVAEVQTALDTIADNKKSATLDDGHWAKITATPKIGSTLEHLTVAGTDAEVYDSITDAGVLDDQITAETGTSNYKTTDGEVWVKVNSDTTVTAVWKTAEYEVQVTVKKDNVVWTGEAGLKVELYHETNNAKIKDLSDDVTADGATTHTGVFKGKVPAGKYRVFANGVDLGNAVFTEAAKNFDFSPYDAEGKDNDGNALTSDALATAKARLTKELNYYTINLAVDPDNSATTAKSSGTVDFGALTGGSHTTPPADSATTKAKMIVLAKSTTQTINIRSAPYVNEAGGVRYRFDTWTATKQSNVDGALEIGSFEKGGTPEKIYQSGAYTLPKESDLKTYTGTINGEDKQLTLTAKMKRQWKVSVDKGLNADNNTVPQVSLSSTSGWNNNYVYVDDGDPVYLQTSSIGNKLHFMDWTIKVVDNVAQGAGTFNKNTAAATDKTVGTLKADGTNYPRNLNDFIPTKDTVIVVNLWKEADAKAQWTYDKGTGTLTSTIGNPLPPNITWTPNHGETPTTLAIQKRAVGGGAAGTLTPLTKNTDYTVSADGLTYTLDFESATLSALELGTYDVYFTYTLGDDGDADTTEHNPVPNTQASTFFILTATKRTLRQVDIGVSTDTTATTLNEHAAAKDQAVYVRHWEKNPANSTSTDLIASDAATNASKIPHDELEFTWYYSNTAPNASSPSKIYANAAAVTTEVNRVSATALTTAQAAALVKVWTDGTHNIATGTLNVDAATLATLGDLAATLQGKNIFAVVKVKDDSVVAEGTVITNSILVDYDASVKVQQNGTGIAAANKDDYRVYFVPSTVTPAQTDFATPAAMTAKGIVQAAYNTTLHDGTYETSNSALAPNKNYNVYVNDAQGVYTAIVNSGAKTITRLDKANRVVDFYTVTPIDFTWHELKTNSGETTSEVKIGSLTTANNTAIDLANKKYGVLKGSNVKALADGTNWTQDYNLSWQAVEGAAFNTNSPYDVVAANKTKTDATTNGYTWNTVDAATIIGGRLIQNTYTLTGVIRDVNGATGGESGELNTATLTIQNGENTITYTGTVGSSGCEKGTVSFTVPKGTYTLTSTVKTGSTHKGYYKGNDTSAKPAEATPKHVPDTPQDELKLDELTAGTNGATVSGRFTIYVVKTALTLNLTDQDGHTTNNISGTNKATATHTVKTDEEAKIVFNYDAFPETVTVKNMGNTPLKLTATLQSKALTDADTAFTSVTLTDGEDGKGTTFVYTKKIAADGTETTETTNLVTGNDGAFVLQPGEAREVTITIPDSLENKDDLTYRLTFDAKDGRDGTTHGPVVGYDLKVEIDPVTIGRVTTWNDDGTFRVQDHWLKEDAIRKGVADNEAALNAAYASNTPKNHNYAAETLGTGDTTMDDLDKQSATITKDNSDIFYRWYVGDPDATVRFKSKTTGELECTNGKTLTEVTDQAGDGGTSYKPTAADHGKMLYLVAVGQRNATNAVMTPDKDTFHEEPVPIPYPATITIWENKMGASAAERTKVKEADKGNYTVWLWDVTGGKTDELDINDTTGRAIEAKAVADEDGTYKTDVVLYPDHTYQVWTSAAKKVDTAFYLRNTGITIASVDQKEKDVDYYLVDVANTTLSQNDYEGNLGTIADDSTVFYNENDLTDSMEAPSAKMPAKGETAGTLDVANNYVLKDTNVTLGYPARTLDYDLNWTGGYTNGGNPDAPGVAVTHVVNYSAATAQIKTELKLKVYDVVAWVTGSLGSVDQISMTMNDGVENRVFTTTGDTTKGEIAGLKNGEKVNSISTTDQNKTFRLPKANYDTVATYDADVYTLQCYKYPHNGADKGKENFVVPVTANTSYDVVLQGEGFSMQVADDVDDQTQKNTNSATGVTVSGVWSDSADPKQQDGSQTQTIKLNYNYNADQKVKLTVTNASQQPKDESADRVILYDITFTADATADNPIILSTDTGDTNSFADGAVVDSLDDEGSATVTLKIPSGLGVGTYEYTAKFDFKTTDGGADGASATYKLVVEVEPLTFSTVDVKKNDDGKLIIDPATDKQYTVSRKVTAEDGENPDLIYRDLPNTTTTDPDTNGKLLQDVDYGYQWISAPVGTTDAQVKAALTWSNGTLTVGNANGVLACTGTDATAKTYEPKAADSGRSLFLVIYGTDNTDGIRHNATGFAVSPAQVNTYKGMVALKVDGAEKRGKDDADSADTLNKPDDGDGYEVWFVSKDNANVKKQAEWKQVGTEYAYVADLTPNTSGYYVTISRARDDNKQETLPGVTISGGNDLATTTIDTTKSNVAEAPFFTVTAVKLTAKAFNDGPSTGEDFDYVGGTNNKSKDHTDILPEVYINEEKLTSGTPVLKGQSVAAKIPSVWTQDYTLTWQMDNAAGADDIFVAANDTAYVQKAAEAIVDAAYPHGAVNAKTYIGGRLDQNTYDIVGHVKGKTTPQKNQVVNVTLEGNGVLYYSDTDPIGIPTATIWQNKWAEPLGVDGYHNTGDTITFTVVAGTYDVTAYEGEGYTIRSVTIPTAADATPAGTPGATRNTNKFNTDVKGLDADARHFWINLEPAGPQLKVTDTETSAHTATSGTGEADHKFANNNDGALYVYKTLTADDVFTLNLHNPGNVDLTLKDPEVYKVKTGTDYSDSAKLQTALGNATVSTKETLTNHGWTDVDGTRTIVTIAGLPAANADVKIGAGETGSGVNAVPAGSITVNQNVYNKDDAIYVVKFASKYTTTDGSPAGDTDGPTVYYVLNLKVEPLPLKELQIERAGTSDKLRLIGFDSADATGAKSGLDNVKVDADGKAATTELATAKDKALTTPGDISFVWVKAPADMERDDVVNALSLDKTNNKMLSSHADVKVTTVTDREHTPVAADQGLNFYLVAFRTNADSNADDFAVSNAMYAQVTVSMKAYRTGETTKDDDHALTDVFISHGTGESMKKSNGGKVVVTGIEDGANELDFSATKTDVTAKDTTNDPPKDNPNAAKYYFHHWAVQPLTGDELNATDDSVTTPVEGERLDMKYTATANSTVIGYFDLLPVLNGFGGYNTGDNSPGKDDTAAAKLLRTMNYRHNDGMGAGNVEIIIKKGTGSFIKEDPSVDEISLNNVGYFETVAGTSSGDPSAISKFGGDGAYVFTHTWLKDNLGEGTYTITFYDKGKGQYSNPLAKTLNEGGYAGYDKSFTLTISQGEKEVTAKVNLADGETNPGHQVRLSNDKPNDQLEAGEKNDTGLGAGPVQLYTFNGSVNIFATPADGYVFTGWTRADGEDDGTFGVKYEEDGTTKINDTFTPAKPSRTILANFRKVAYTTTPGHAKIHYGTKSFLANSDEHPDYYKDLDITTADTATTALTYEWLTGDDLTAYLTKTTANGGAGLSAADAAVLVGKTTTADTWLDWDGTNHKFVVTAAAKGVNVEKKTVDGALADVDNELTVYVKVTETNSEQEFVIPFTIDIMTSELKIRTTGTGESYADDETQQTTDGTAYKNKYTTDNASDTAKVFTAEGGTKYIIHGNTVELDKFEFISIDNVKDLDKQDHLIEALGTGSHNAGEDVVEGKPTSVVDKKGYWTIEKPANKILSGSGSAEENAAEYIFKFNYTGVNEGDDKAVDDYNYTSPSITLKIPVQRPQRDLLIADEVENYGDLKRGTTYSDIEAPSPDDGTTPTKLLAGHDTKRLGESITYLDEEPVYTAKFQRIGAFDEGSIKLELDPETNKTVVGFALVKTENGKDTLISLDDTAAVKTMLDAAAEALDEDGAETSLKLALAPVHDNVWVGTHYIRFKLSGTENGETLERWYTLSIDVAPKVITKLDVTVTDPETEPTKVEGTTDDKKVNDKDEDDKGNVPITDVTVTWGPEENKPDGKNTEVKVDVKIDPNYVYAEDDPTTPDDNEDIEHKTDLTVAEHGTPKPADVNRDMEDGDHIVHITQKIPYLMHDDVKVDSDPADTTGPKMNDSRTVTVQAGTDPATLGKYTINLGAYGGNVYDVQWTVEDAATSKLIGNGEGSLGATLGTLPTGFDLTGDGAKQSVELDLTTITGTLAAGSTYSFTLKAIGKANDVTDEEEEPSILSTYTFTLRVSNPPSPPSGPSEPACPCKVLYHIGTHGTTTDATIEDVSESSRPSKVPAVTPLDGYVFRGWSQTNPATLKKGEKITLVDPKTVTAKGETMIFYAVIVERPFHEHYVIGYPNGNFGPADNIDRASVATIIARAILPDFKEGANYGNPGGYSDVSGHWAESAIAYCSKFGVFEGYTDGTFKPNQPITRQEFALVIARLDGVMTPGEMDFTDIDEAGSWALGGIYTAYAKGWVNGYTDGTFKPLNNIRRDEAVKVFNAYLNRGVDADGLRKLHEYVHSGVASNVTGNGTDEYMTWPDVPQGHWAYYEIVEAANDHEYVMDFESELGYTLPEEWDKCWIDERWRYHDDLTDGGPNAALLSAGFRVWLH